MARRFDICGLTVVVLFALSACSGRSGSAPALPAAVDANGRRPTGSQTGSPPRRYTVTELNPPPGFSGMDPLRINASGEIAGVAYSADGLRQVAVEITRAGATEIIDGTDESSATGINDAGSIAYTALTGGVERGFVTSARGVRALQAPAGEGAHTEVINGRGLVAGYVSPAPAQARATLWDAAGGAHDLGTLPGYSGSYAFGLNESGIAVGEADAANASRAVEFANGAVIDLGSFGGRRGSALGINDAGVVVGYSSDPTNEMVHAFVYDDSMHQLPGYISTDSAALAINDAGDVVGYNRGEPFYIAVLWHDRQPFALSTLLVNGDGWRLDVADAIDNKGDIVGHGYHDNVARAFLLTPR